MKPWLLWLAQFSDPSDSFTQKYFSFIVLGLVMTIGYIVFRVQKSKKEKQQQREDAESELRRFEQELMEERERKAAEVPKDAEPEQDVLALTPEQEAERERLKSMAEKPAFNQTGKSDLEDEPGSFDAKQ